MHFIFSNGSGRLRRHPLNRRRVADDFSPLLSQIMRLSSRIMETGDRVGCMPDTATYTHGHAESVLRSHRTRTAENSAAYLLPYLRAGQSLLDIGSGPGTITVDLAQRVAPWPDSVERLIERFHVRPDARMIIFLGRQSPGASGDLPGSRNGSGRSANG
jgi:hypothetical protein